MKTRLLITCIVVSPLVILIPQAYANCDVNEDWPEAPCLDLIINGRYNQDDVNKWSDYYSYKGSAFMELKYLALNEAIEQNRLEEWVDDSIINQNVYQYYFFSGRAPNIGQIHGDFDVITVNEETFPEEILILVENKMRKVYYTGENIISILADPESASITFETGENAKLDVKAPRIYKIGPGLFVLHNGEEVEAVKDADECFFYATIETQEPAKIEIVFAAWPEYKELVENCETFEEESSVYAVPFSKDKSLEEHLKENNLPIGQGVYMNFTVFLVLLGGGIGGAIFAIRRKRK